MNLNDILTSTESMDNILFVGFVGVLDRGITSCSCTVIDLALFFFGRRRSFVKYFGFVSFVIGIFFFVLGFTFRWHRASTGTIEEALWMYQFIFYDNGKIGIVWCLASIFPC